MTKPKRILKYVLRVLAILLAVLLALILLLAAVPFAGSIGLKQEALPAGASKTLRRAHVGERWMTGLGRIADALTRMPGDLPSAADYTSEYFYPGGKSEENPAADRTWQFGYAQAVITPQDWETKTYYEGGNLVVPPRKLTDKLDDIKVRAAALSADGVNINIFAAVDSIGVTNKQVQQIRALLADMDLQSVNIAATHVHSAVDPLGFYSKGGKADQDYLTFANGKIAGAIREAVAAMEPGKLYLSQIGSVYPKSYHWSKIDAMLGFNPETDEWDEAWEEKYDAKWEEILAEMTIEEYGLGNYVQSRRIWGTEPTRMNKLRFAPENPASKQTIWLNFAAHPFVGGYAWNDWPADKISGDYIYYMEQLINESGANMLFINGAVNGINPQSGNTSNIDYNDYDSDEAYQAAWDAVKDVEMKVDWRLKRMGRDFAATALAMTMEPAEITKNPLTDPGNDHGVEYANIIKIMQNQGTVQEQELAPSLSLKLEQLQVPLENPFVRFAAKRGMLNMNLLRKDKGLVAATEIGKMELGGTVTVALVPGEFTPGLAWRGGDTTKEYAIRQRGFAQPAFSESAGREVIVFGLCNDELGYIIPDNDYMMFYCPDFLAEKLMGSWNYDHYAELLSPGRNVAGLFAQAFKELYK